MNKAVALTCAVLALQVSAVGWLVWRYERIVRNGTEVRLKCRAYDPYDPLRGRYLGMTVSEECTNILFKVTKEHLWRRPDEKTFAKLVKTPDGDGLYRVDAIAREPTDDGLWVKPESVCIRHALGYGDKKKDESDDEFEVRCKKAGFKAVLSFPDQLFVNEKIAPEAEKLLQKKSDSAVAVYRAYGGRIVLTDIEIDGKPILLNVKEGLK